MIFGRWLLKTNKYRKNKRFEKREELKSGYYDYNNIYNPIHFNKVYGRYTTRLKKTGSSIGWLTILGGAFFFWWF